MEKQGLIIVRDASANSARAGGGCINTEKSLDVLAGLNSAVRFKTGKEPRTHTCHHHHRRRRRRLVDEKHVIPEARACMQRSILGFVAFIDDFS